MDDLYDFEVKRSPGRRAQVYVAKVVGEDPGFIFKRKFATLEQHRTKDGYRYEPELDDFGVYERSVKWFEDKPGGKFLGRNRTWYLVFDCMPVPIPPWNVTDTLRWLSRFLAYRGGDDA